MPATIALITLLTDNIAAMREFYCTALGFTLKNDDGEYVEFEHDGVRFSICTRTTMLQATGHPSYEFQRQGQAVELAFPASNAAEVDTLYQDLIAKGATPIKEPADMPWGQRAAFFADPDGNIHELFAEL